MLNSGGTGAVRTGVAATDYNGNNRGWMGVEAKHRPAGRVESDMKPRLHLLLITTFAWIGWSAIDSFQGRTQTAFAQSPDGSSRSESSSRDRDRGRYGDRGSRDWRSSRSRRDEERRGDEKRGDERSSNSD